MAAKLVQQLVYIEQVPLYELCIDLRKAFDAMNRKCFLKMLRDWRVAPKIWQQIKTFWDLALLVCCWGGYFSGIFKAV